MSYTADNAPITFINDTNDLRKINIMKLAVGDRFYLNLWKGQYRKNYYLFKVLRMYEKRWR